MKSIRVLSMAFAVNLVVAFSSHASLGKPVNDLTEGQEGKIVFSSPNHRTFKELAAGKPGKPLEIHGNLKFPEKIEGKVPAVILLHSIGGPRDEVCDQLADTFKNAGFATFLPDSQSPRGVSTAEGASKNISYSMRVSDAYAALKLLGTHPKVDRNRIAAVGFSRGGGVALLAAAERFRTAFIQNDLKFAAHVAFYPSPFLRLDKSARLTGSPVLMLLAELDTITPCPLAVDWSEQLRSSGTDVKVVVYEGAAHGFLMKSLSGRTKTLQFMKDYTNCKERYLQIKEDGSVFYPYRNNHVQDTDALMDVLKDCAMDKGGTLGDPTKIREQSEIECLNFLKNVSGTGHTKDK